MEQPQPRLRPRAGGPQRGSEASGGEAHRPADARGRVSLVRASSPLPAGRGEPEVWVPVRERSGSTGKKEAATEWGCGWGDGLCTRASWSGVQCPRGATEAGQGVERGRASDPSSAAHEGTVESRLVTPRRGPAACGLSSALGMQAESGEGEAGNLVVPGGLSSATRGRTHTCTRVCVQIHRHAHINAVTCTRVNTCARACLTHVYACVRSHKLVCALIHMNTSTCVNKHPQDTHQRAYTQAHHTHVQGSGTGESLRTPRPRAPAPCLLGVAILGGGPAQTADQGAVAQVGGLLGCLAGHHCRQ